MGISVTEDTTTIEVSGDTTVTVTENVTSVSVSDSTATLTVQPSETTVAVTGNTTSINVEAETQEILVNESSYLGNFGGQTLNGSLYVTGHLTHGGVLTDTSSIKHTDFTSAGFMRTDGSGNYTVDSNTYLTSFTELNNLSASVTWADVPDNNITETSVTQHQSALSIEESQISDLQSYLTSYTETDPVFSAHASSGITATQILNWDTAYGWGDHSGAGYLTSETSHDDVLVDGDFATAGFMKTDGAGNYSIDNSTYLTSFTEANDLSTSVTWANVPDQNITENSVTQHQTALSITESQISDFGTYLTAHQDISGKADLSGATFTGAVTADTFTGGDTVLTQTGILPSDAVLTLRNTDSGNISAPHLLFDRVSGSPADADGIGSIVFQGRDSATVNTPYVYITGKADDVTNNTEDGQLQIYARKAGANVLLVDLTSEEMHLTNGTSLNASGGITTSGNIIVSGTVDGVDIAGLETTVTGKADLSGATFTGTITAPNVDISTSGSVTTNIATGTGGGNDSKAVNIATGYSAGGTTTVNIAPTNSTTTRQINLNGNVNVDGSITAPNLDIQKVGDVTTNIATGIGGSGNTKTVNIATGYGTGGTTIVNIAPTSSTTAKQINLNGDVSISGAVISEIDATIASPSQNTPILKLRKNSASANGTGRFITFVSSTTSGGGEITRGLIGLSNVSSPQYTNPYMSHTSGSNGILCAYSPSSNFNAIAPCASTGLTSNGTLNLGHAYAKWNTVYASSGSINTSDITKKQDIEELSEAESRVAMAAKGLLRKYRWKEAVSEKGDNARIHFGIMAQDLKAAFEAEGLDANQYGMFCADTRWTTDGTDTYATEEEAMEAVAEEETPKAITEETVYGVRYEELLAFIIAAI